jgi:V/A-type H+-transporting ATPase subunit D
MLEKFAYNKSTIQDFQRQLKVRRAALPVLLRKETALRQFVSELKNEIKEKEKTFTIEQKRLSNFESIWNEFPPLVKVKELKYRDENIAGTKVKTLEDLIFEDLDLNLLFEPAWFPAATEALINYIKAHLSLENIKEKLQSLEIARKKTTQKVNLYEKLQIPAYDNAIRQIKRFLEDKENIATAAKKIAKNKTKVRHES